MKENRPTSITAIDPSGRDRPLCRLFKQPAVVSH
ncbi:hypothetical protein P9738_06385 [Bacillus siamensis]|nr:hypothetical protein [Bacillus siamensis]